MSHVQKIDYFLIIIFENFVITAVKLVTQNNLLLLVVVVVAAAAL
jgi:hypothetical protein